jgi:hypothetical protein
MKTYLKLFVVATLSLFFFGQRGFTQSTEKSVQDNLATGTTIQGKFVDKDNDGVCDNYEAKGKNARCANYVDKDGNGVCDNCGKGSGSYMKVNCQGHQHGKGCGEGQANCCGRGPCQGKGPGNCCPNKQGPTQTTPAETPDPKK